MSWMWRHEQVARPQGYIDTLDGWRAVAITLVLISHFSYAPSPLSQLRVVGMSLGPKGVDLFFALSGVLITTRLTAERNRTGSISLRQFYLRRAFRLLPASLTYLVILGLLGSQGICRVSLNELAASIFCLRNYTGRLFPGVNTGHFWSLSLEEHYYFAWPALLRHCRGPAAIWTTSLLIVLATGWRAWEVRHDLVARLFPQIGAALPEVGVRTDLRLDALLFGCLSALLYEAPAKRELLRGLLRWPVAAVVFLIYLAVAWHMVNIRGAFSLQAVALPSLILSTVLYPRALLSRLLESRLFRYVGRISYSLYVWQQIWLMNAWRFNAWGRWAVPLMAFACAGLSYHFIESRMISVGQRITRGLTTDAGLPRSTWLLSRLFSVALSDKWKQVQGGKNVQPDLS